MREWPMRSRIAQHAALGTALWTAFWTGLWTVVRDDVRDRWAAVRRDPDAGYSTETVLVTALLVVAALVVVAIIVAKVTEKANEITLGLG